MDLLLNEEQLLLRDAATKLAARAGPRRARELRNAGIEIDRTAWSGMVEAGWLPALVPAEKGGLGLGLFDLALALEATGRQIVMAPLIEAAAAIWAVSEATDAAHPARAATEATIVAAATTPPGQRYDGVASPSLDPNAMALSGSVSFVAFAPSADLFLVDAKAGGEAILCLVRRDAPGLAVATTPNVDGSTSSTLTFSRAAVADGDIIARGEVAAAIATKMQELLVLGTSAELLGVAEAALDVTLAYAKLREQFGRKIGSFQALQHRMVDCYVDAELNRSLLFKVLSAWDAGACHPAMVSAVKARVGKGALKTVRAALQLHGAIGYTDEHDIGIYYKRAVALAAKYGNEITHVGRFSGLTLAPQRAAE
jgi:alkylation response protein AidB-like acyl-CoA dehydrogenase